jgi:hypothetical protein
MPWWSAQRAGGECSPTPSRRILIHAIVVVNLLLLLLLLLQLVLLDF